MQSKDKDLDCCITCFQNKVKEGLYFICTVCAIEFFTEKQLIEFKKSKYSIQRLFTEKKSFDYKKYKFKFKPVRMRREKRSVSLQRRTWNFTPYATTRALLG